MKQMAQLTEKLQYLNEILDDKTYITGEIYLIINLINCKSYIGQVVSHRKNHDKYRPFGHTKRFKDHVSEALCQTKHKQCNYLNNAIRKYGVENFTVELICRCELSEIDQYEEKYIDQYQTLYPDGYNLTTGGKGKFYVAIVKNNNILPAEKPAYSHTDETKKKISVALRKTLNKPESRMRAVKNAQNIRDKKKLAKFANCLIDHDNLEQYIHPVISRETGEIYYFKVYIDGTLTRFTGPSETPEALKLRAINFLKQLPSISA